MTTYTQAEPFEFEGDRLYRTDKGDLAHALGHSKTFYLRAHPEAIHAFIEAERHRAQWTEQEDGTWRKGRWTGGVDTTGRPHPEYVMHDDFPGSQWRKDQGGYGTRFLRTGHAVLDDFLAFHAARTKPEFTPLPVPEVGQWGEFMLRDGSKVAGSVASITNAGDHVALTVDGETLTMNLSALMEDNCKWPTDITAWHPIDPPQPAWRTAQAGDLVEVKWTESEAWKRALKVQDGRLLDATYGFEVQTESIIDSRPVTIESPGVEK